jgi:hypothetical protein
MPIALKRAAGIDTGGFVVNCGTAWGMSISEHLGSQLGIIGHVVSRSGQYSVQHPWKRKTSLCIGDAGDFVVSWSWESGIFNDNESWLRGKSGFQFKNLESLCLLGATSIPMRMDAINRLGCCYQIGAFRRETFHRIGANAIALSCDGMQQNSHVQSTTSHLI